ncbi:hypothetical protein I3843_07G170000 [Carya illinoinensis]|uniref:BSD domain-containing protein n=1 Tax=Carya illinoinensis TaxID=32201 RepID=A0A8T1Q652_CARIL|nr:uncharacterized protein LOC122315650 [Carya illinoinensis]KAG2698935.1 hypothetical protein I3760_07G170200 [Carya illinoinensis]KAG6648850.1 hypothetical protein CIPAW_07G173000 [Carya illinoinensis]KAG7972170.1 hypothetical protein I3843_07G170000 [Carya illinoinensis]
MSWFARSLANSLRIDDDKDEDNDVVSECAQDPDPPPSSSTKPAPARHQQQQQYEPEDNDSHSEEAQSRGVKDDLSELKQTLTRQIWGMASFLAPPPSQLSTLPHCRHSEPSDRYESGDRVDPSDDEASGIRSDIGEDEGTFRSGVTEISKVALNFLPFGSERYEGLLEELGLGESVGITEEVLAFARNIAMHPETWLDFPLDEEEDLDDFFMSDAQQEHALAIQHLAPRLAALRIELCPCHMSESYFWKVYFVLLHSRLNKHDADILSSPQVVAARAMWMQELQKITKENTDWFARSTSHSKDSAKEEDFDPIPPIFSFEPTSSTVATDFETEKHPIENTELEFIDKSVIVEEPTIKTENKDLLGGPSSKPPVQNFEDDEDDWPEEDSELGRYSGAAICVGNEDDISFSDLEDDDYSIVPITSKTVASKS